MLLWQKVARLSFEYLIDLSLAESYAFKSLATDLLSCESISDMMGEVIIWSSFTSTSTNRNCVIKRFMKNKDSILSEIAFYPGNIAVSMKPYSVTPFESEILIAASTGFKIDEVEYVDIQIQESDDLNPVMIPVVKMTYFLSWSDFDIDECPPKVLVEGDKM
jgi:hypothetical protein